MTDTRLYEIVSISSARMFQVKRQLSEFGVYYDRLTRIPLSSGFPVNLPASSHRCWLHWARFLRLEKMMMVGRPMEEEGTSKRRGGCPLISRAEGRRLFEGS